jgi:hypothetical protein
MTRKKHERMWMWRLEMWTQINQIKVLSKAAGEYVNKWKEYEEISGRLLINRKLIN